ncbi:nucleotide-binding universal stress UspA family protein [Arthrobacter sp. UYCu511]|uniref:universal stress protein n=1 Tax=Arthrobacter sp. UYCu511 TaxID=3156337 RepID=UPI003398AAFE
MVEAMEEERVHERARIVVGVDGSPESVLALKWAQTLAHSLDATITAVTAWHVDTMFGTYISPDWDPNEDARRILRIATHEAFGDNPPKGFTGVSVRGRPAQALLESAQSAQMLIVGSRGRGGFTGMLLGSVSSACAEHASCPVLVVHGTADIAEAQAALDVSHEVTEATSPSAALRRETTS